MSTPWERREYFCGGVSGLVVARPRLPADDVAVTDAISSRGHTAVACAAAAIIHLRDAKLKAPLHHLDSMGYREQSLDLQLYVSY